MTLTDRDRKIAMVLVPLALLAGMYFLVLKPKLAEVSAAGEELTSQEQRRDEALAKVKQLEGAKTSFAADYAEVVRLGKAIPSDADLPSLLVQLDKAAGGSDVDFDTVRVGERGAGASGGAQPAGGGSSGGSGGSQPAAASGGAPAQSGPGQAAESANETKDDADAKSAESEQQGEGSDSASEGDASSSAPAPGGGAAAPGGTGASGAPAVPGLETVPLEFEFKGSFFDLVKLTHKVKRFVHLANDKLRISGRLMTIDSLTFKTDEDDPGKLDAELSATVYLTPAAQGVAAGAAPQGPAGATPAAAPSGAPGGAASGGGPPGGPPPGGGEAPGGAPTAPVTQ